MNPIVIRETAEPERVTGSYSYTSAHRPQTMTAERATEVYARLRPFLRLQSPWGMYLPKKTGSKQHDLSDWPLAYRAYSTREIQFPTPITWNPHTKTRPPTFQEFLTAYQITVTGA